MDKNSDRLTLVPYFPNEKQTLRWYQDPKICKQVDNIDTVYDLTKLRRMYEYLSVHGWCYYIQYQGKLIGDCTLLKDGEISIVICKEYQNLHLGRKCVDKLVQLARIQKMTQVKAHIYDFNIQSKKMFTRMGFKEQQPDWYSYDLQIKNIHVTK